MFSKLCSILFCGLIMPVLHVEAQPNVILVLMDDMGWSDSSTYGSKYYQTPNLKRLANEGMLFTDAHASPLCSPTRASILTGQHPSRLRMTLAVTPGSVFEPRALAPQNNKYCGLVESRNHLPQGLMTLPQLLKAAGYKTAHIGKWHLAPTDPGWKTGDVNFYAEHYGFDFIIGGRHLPGPPHYYSPYGNGIRHLEPGPHGEYLNERLAEEAIKWMASVKRDSQPFFLNFWHYAVHGPIVAKKDLLPKYKELRDPEADQRCPEMAPMLESMDTSIGMLLDWLDKPGNRRLKSNTLILLTSDNGGVIHKNINENPWTSNRPLRGGKANIYEGGSRVPWIVSWPKRVGSGTICETRVQCTDIYPTLLSIAQVIPPENQIMGGHNILPLLDGKSIEDRPIFTHFPHLFGHLCAPATSVLMGDWKLIRFYHAGKDAASHAYELFNLKKDAAEAIDLSTYFPEKVAELDRYVESHLKDTDALVHVVNKNYSGNPRKSRTNRLKAPNCPNRLKLPETSILTIVAGSKRLQLTDHNNQPRKTHALVLEGDEWVQIENSEGGGVHITWQTPPEDGFAKVLFGWKGGVTSWEINDWTIPPCELVLGPSVKLSKRGQAVPTSFEEGFNSDLSSPDIGGSHGLRFGVHSPGICRDDSVML